MALRNLHALYLYHGGLPLKRLSSSPGILTNRTRMAQAAGFKKILSACQPQPKKIAFKTKGLTITDYRARPVVSKSRRTPFSRRNIASLTPTDTNRFSGQRPPAKIKEDQLKAHLPAEKMNEKKVSTDQPLRSTHQQQAAITDQQIIARNVQKAAAKYNLPPALINAVIRAESNFNIRAVSPAGARGLMQLMPATAKELGVENPFDIEQNIDGGARYLRKMLDRFGGSVRKALAAYNAGPGTVIKYKGRVPYPETRQYVKRVLRFSRQMA